MHKEFLVDEDREAARALVEMLNRKRFKIQAFGWVPWGMYYKLALATPLLRSRGPLVLYQSIDKLLDPAGRLTLFDLMLIDLKDELVRQLAS